MSEADEPPQGNLNDGHEFSVLANNATLKQRRRRRRRRKVMFRRAYAEDEDISSQEA